jgi:hypothetical protein
MVFVISIVIAVVAFFIWRGAAGKDELPIILDTK